jgi:GNAT superfamily N-acetyltransferase
MIVRQMSLADLEGVLDWARQEGWNPGVEDAAAFLAADPAGFFLAEVDGRPAAAISVVNHDATQAFLGLYICRPDYRGQGHGYALWQHALQHAGTRTVGLDGVPEQQDNYALSGFRSLGRTLRYKGTRPEAQGTARQMTADDLPALIAADAQAVGHARPAFITGWLTGTSTRKTVVIDGPLPGFACFRRCDEGVKVGPLIANDRAQALSLLAACPKGIGTGPLYVDVPAQSDLSALAQDIGLSPVFETARMVRGRPPLARPPAFYGVATLDLG